MRRLIVVWLGLLSCGVVACDGGSGEGPGADAVAVVDTVADIVEVLGSPDTISDANAECLLSKSWTDYPAGPKQCRRFEYDDEGKVVLEGVDNDCDGVEEKCEVTEWDDAGRKTGDYEDKDCDGTVDAMCLWWDHDDDAASMEWTEDYDCDGIPEFLRTYVYDEEGRVILEAVEEGEESGFASYCFAYAYDELGNEIEKKSGATCEGPWGSCVVTSFDAEGVQTAKHQDTDCDGIPDKNCRTYEITTDEDGTIHMWQRLDRHCDETDMDCWTTDATADWYVLASSTDEGCDGVVESCFQRVFDGDGNLLHSEREEPCGAEPSICAEAFTLDGNGWQVSSQGDANCDGLPDDCETFVHDDQGRVLETTMDEDCDGMSSPWCEFFEFDAHGNLVEHRTEQVCGDDDVILEHWDFDCGP